MNTPIEYEGREDEVREMGRSIRTIVRNRRANGHSDDSIASEIMGHLVTVAAFNGHPPGDSERDRVLALAGELTREALGTAGPTFRVVG